MRVMQGHAAANMVPVIVTNRVGMAGEEYTLSFMVLHSLQAQWVNFYKPHPEMRKPFAAVI